jgi:pimeloyl-ACP methyl ester carboxylesterase
MIPLVLIHGGAFDSRCWDLLLRELDGPAIAVDLPGRGRHPLPLAEVTLDVCVRSVLADIEDAGFDEVALVGHSLAGTTMPGVMGLLGDRVRHATFVACTVPTDGTSSLDTLDPDLQVLARAGLEHAAEHPAVLEGEMAKLVLGDDLDDDQLAWCTERTVPEAPNLVLEPVDLSPLRSPVPRTWIRTMGDTIVAPDKQLRFAANVGDCPVVDLDAGHMCMVSRPAALAALLRDRRG